MTLQFRIRSKYADELWRHRVYLCEQFVLDTLDNWCLSDSEFPGESTIAGVLYLFSPRCKPYSLCHHRIGNLLGKLVSSPAEEYRLVWPRRKALKGDTLIASLRVILERAVASWNTHGNGYPRSDQVAQRMVEEIVDQQYVIFHHYETTRRDINLWGI